MSEIGIPFGFDTYGTKKGGLVVGSKYKSVDSGKVYRFCQNHTASAVGSAIVAYSPVAQLGAVTVGIATDDVSAGLSATHPICLGVATSACPVSTASITYYFWAQTDGPLHTSDTGTTFASITMNNDDDAAIGDTIIMTANDNLADTVGVGTAAASCKSVGTVLVAVVASTNLVTGVLLRTGL